LVVSLRAPFSCCYRNLTIIIILIANPEQLTMKLITAALLTGVAAAFAPVANQRASTQLQESKEDLAVLAKKLNPVLGYFDPLGLADDEFWGTSNEATIGFLRESEIK
jgi:hypothetical protein